MATIRLTLLPSVFLTVVLLVSCDVNSGVNGSGTDGNGTQNGISIEPEKPVFDGQPGTPGFFLDLWEPLVAEIPPHTLFQKPAGDPEVVIFVDTEDEIEKISPALFGNNANTYMTQIVTEPDLLGFIRDLSPHLIRFPGGNLSNLYFWNADPGEPPVDAPDVLINGNTGQPEEAFYWYGNHTASWTISLENYYKTLEETGSTGMFTVNYSYARYGTGPKPVQTAAQLAADWVRHDNGRTRYWEIGNENGGPWQSGYLIDTSLNQDGQPERISGELYGEHVRVFADSMRAAAVEIGADIKIGAQLIHFEASNHWNPVDRDWNEGFFSSSADEVTDFYIVHDYYTPFEEDSSPETILQSAGPVTNGIMKWMNTTFDLYQAEPKPIAFTEWNIFAVGSRQMVSDISGIHAAMAVGEMAKNSFGMAARWNLSNGWENGNDHGMFNSGDEPGGVPRWNPRPDFYHLYFLQRTLGDTMLFSWEQGGAAKDITSYASIYSTGETGVVLVNTGTASRTSEIRLLNGHPGDHYYWYTISGGGEAGFSRTVSINDSAPTHISGGPLNYKEIDARMAVTEGGIKVDLPGRSAVYLIIE